MKLKTACIAVGGYGRIYLDAMIQEALKGRVRLVACADPFPPADFDQAVAVLGSERPVLYKNHKEMLSKERGLDAVTIGTGLHLHYPMLVDALAAGCHVILAKPAAVTVQSIDAMIAAEIQHHKKVLVDFQHTYTDGTTRIMAAIAAGRLGTVREITTTLLWHRADDYYTRNNWTGKFKLHDEYVLDGPLSNPHAHYINNALYFAHPDPQQFAMPVSVRAELYQLRNLETEDNACLEIKTNTGVTIHHYSTLTCKNSDQETRITVTGEKGFAVWTPQQAAITIDEKTEAFDFSRGTSAMVVSRFLDFLTNGGPEPLTTLKSSRNHVLALNGAWESAREVCPIPEKYHITEENNGTMNRSIRGIRELIHDAAGNRKLYSEMNCPWSRPSQAFNLTGYRRFHL